MQGWVELFTATGRELRPLEGNRLTIGRHDSNDVVLADDHAVSRVHAVLEQIGPSWVVRDLSSRNGTRVNGDLISADRPLSPGDEVRIGSNRLVFRGADSPAYDLTVGAEPPPTLTPRERDVLLELFRPTGQPGAFNEPASTRDIATALVVSEAAVKQHLARLYDKFGIHAGLDRRRMRLANEALRRAAVSMADVRARFGDSGS
jgi:DNA-binding CsgD family transcriptional regulator